MEGGEARARRDLEAKLRGTEKGRSEKGKGKNKKSWSASPRNLANRFKILQNHSV